MIFVPSIMRAGKKTWIKIYDTELKKEIESTANKRF